MRIGLKPAMISYYRHWAKRNGIRFAAALMRNDGYPVETAVQVLRRKT